MSRRNLLWLCSIVYGIAHAFSWAGVGASIALDSATGYFIFMGLALISGIREDVIIVQHTTESLRLDADKVREMLDRYTDVYLNAMRHGGPDEVGQKQSVAREEFVSGLLHRGEANAHK